MAEERIETPEVSFSLAGETLRLRDEAGGGEVVAELAGDTSLTRATTSWFDVPMDAAVSFETELLRFENTSQAVLREPDGPYHGALTGEPFTVETCGAFVELSSVLKLLVYVEDGPVSGHLAGPENDYNAVVIEFEDPTRVVLGGRSYHEQPTATMTVPVEPEALMTAAGYLGSSIKEWSAERSWPTLRGHPPAIEIGDALEIPDRLSKPDTGVQIAVPAELDEVLRVLPLAYYFGAEVVPGERAELRFAGHTEPLGSGQALERSVEETLQRCLVLDSLVRSAGYHRTERVEYEALAPELPFYPPELYDEPIDRQLLEYFEVPYADIEPHAPRWPATATLAPTATGIESVPTLLDRFARIRVTDDGRPRAPDGSARTPLNPLATATTVPAGVASFRRAGRERAAGYEVQSAGRCSVALVGWEGTDSGPFQSREWEHQELDGTPTLHHRPSTTRSTLREALGEAHAAVHFDGELSPEGFVCDDGVLRFDDIPEPNVGAISAVCPGVDTGSVSDVVRAAAVGCLHERPLSRDAVERFAVYLVNGASVSRSAVFAGIDDQMRFVGDASLVATMAPSGVPPMVFSVDRAAEGYRVSVRVLPRFRGGLGSVSRVRPPQFPEAHRLSNSRFEAETTLSAAELVELGTSDGVFRFSCAPPAEFPRSFVSRVPESSDAVTESVRR